MRSRARVRVGIGHRVRVRVRVRVRAGVRVGVGLRAGVRLYGMMACPAILKVGFLARACASSLTECSPEIAPMWRPWSGQG